MPATVASLLGDALFTRREQLLLIPNEPASAAAGKRGLSPASRPWNAVCSGWTDSSNQERLLNPGPQCLFPNAKP
jgi:hypothetical protein